MAWLWQNSTGIRLCFLCPTPQQCNGQFTGVCLNGNAWIVERVRILSITLRPRDLGARFEIDRDRSRRVTPIDAVITWVDGNDPAQRQRLDSYLHSLGRARPSSADPTRFDDAGELEYCVASLLRFAPWFRHIHIVTDRQTPALMSKLAGTPWAKRLRVVDHAEIFADYERYLPTFNSRAISAMLWRIPGIAEQFVCLNDDFMLLRRIAAQDFFRDDHVVLRGDWRRQSAQSPWRNLFKRWRKTAPPAAGNRQAQQRSARMMGFSDRYFGLYHMPYVYRRATMANYFASNPKMLDAQLTHRLRCAEQFLAESLSAHLEIAQDHAEIDNRLRIVQLKPAEQAAWRLRAKLRRADHDPSCAFACVQSLDLAPPAIRSDILAWLDRRVGSLGSALASATQT